MPATGTVIVVGSGFGGAVAAARLAEAGLGVIVIERGPWRDTLPVRSMGIEKRAPFPAGRGALKSLVRTLRSALLPGGGVTLNRDGLFEIHIGKGLNVVCSSGVGGGSHVYAGLNVGPPEAGYWDGITDALSDAEMAPRYERLLREMGSRAPMADDCLPHTLEERFRDSDVIDARGADYEFAMGFAFPGSPGHPRTVRTEDGIERREATPGADGNLGSPGGGKTSVDFAFLAGAMRRHGLRVLDRCEVRDIYRHGDAGGYLVGFRNHHTGAHEELAADTVVLAAGTMNTLRLLLHGQARGTLAAMPNLGRRFGGNGDFFGYWDLNDTQRDLSRTMPAHGPLRVKPVHPLGARRAWPMLVEGALPAPETLPLGRWVAKKFRHGTFVAGIGADAQDGVVTYHKGRMTVRYDPQRSEVIQRIKDAFRFIGEKTGRRIYHFERPITVHPTGGACIGPDAGDGVVDDLGEVFANPGLYVADAAALPRPVGGPPSMTIAAWADRVAAGIVARRACGPSD